MTQLTKEKFDEIIKIIEKKYKMDIEDNKYTIHLNTDVNLILFYNDDDTVKVELLDDECVTQAPFKIIESIVEVNWEYSTYTRRVDWSYDTDNDDEEYGGDGDIMCDAVDGFNIGDVRPRHFEDNFGELNVETCTEVLRHAIGDQSFEFSVEFCCSASRDQLNCINELFENSVIDHIQGFFDDDGIDGTISADDYFEKD